MDSGDSGIKVIISSDKMAAYVILPDDGRPYSFDEIIEVLQRNGVVFGISQVAVRELAFRERNVPHQVAWGLRPEAPSEGGASRPPVVLRFPLSRGKPPERFPVTFSFRQEWQSLLARGAVKTGTTLAFVRNPERCSVGKTVTGEAVLLFAKEPVLKCGPNARVSPDGSSIVATRFGIPFADDDGVGVLDRVYILGTIGAATQDVEFPGDLVIDGDVQKGFRVSVWGSVAIKGTVYGTVSAAGDVLVEGGIKTSGGPVEAGGSLSARYVENSLVRTRGDVVIQDYVLHSVVETERRLSIPGGKILGGLVRARDGVTAEVVGAPMGVETLIEVGVSPKERREKVKLQSDIASVRSELENIRRIGGSRVKESSGYNALRLTRMLKLLEDKEKFLSERFAAISEAIEKSNGGYFRAAQVLPGTRVFLGAREKVFLVEESQVSLGVSEDEAH